MISKRAGERRRYMVSFATRLEVLDGETLSDPSVSASPSGLTLESPVVSAAAYDKVAAGKGVLFWVEGGAANVVYTITCTVNTSGGAVLQGVVVLPVY